LNIIQIIIIGIGLGMDAFAVSVANGLKLDKMHVMHSFKMAFFFGFFQAVMPVLGWLIGVHIVGFIMAVDHWIAFALLGGIGFKMIHEAATESSDETKLNPGSLLTLLFLSVATSIDAFAVGFTFALLKISILTPVFIIGIITFLMSLAGVYLGKKTGVFLRKKAEIAGGIILIAIGLKIVIEHVFFSHM